MSQAIDDPLGAIAGGGRVPSRIAVSMPLYLAPLLRPRMWMLFDLLAAGLALHLGYMLAPKAPPGGPPVQQYVLFLACCAVAGHILHAYDRGCLRRAGIFFLRGAAVVTCSLGAFTFCSNLILYEQIGRFIVLTTGVIFMGLVLCGRVALWTVARRLRTRVLVVGDGQAAARIERDIHKLHGPFEYVGHCAFENTPSPERLGHPEDMPSLCRGHNVSLVVVGTAYEDRKDVLVASFRCAETGCDIMDEQNFYEKVFERVPVDLLSRKWFYTGELKAHNSGMLLAKRVLDLGLSLCALIITAPLLLATACLIKLTSKGPVLYRQLRCGEFGRTFWIYKFRSMWVDAEQNGAQWADSDDARVTPIGKFLRKSRIDELPQFWNILRGDMSVVGPRPERPELVEEIEKQVPLFEFRCWARPGLTGLAQIKYRYGATIEDAAVKLEHDLFYLKNWSVWLDAEILLRTLSCFMIGSR